MPDETFHATFKPRILNSTEEEVTLIFDNPIEADDVVLLFREIDIWRIESNRIVERRARPRKIARLRGEIREGKFKLNARARAKLDRKGKSGNKPALKLRIDGDENVYELPYPRSAIARERGVFEVSLKVTGKIDKKRKSFVMPNPPLFVRNFKADRPVVAIITGSTRDREFRWAARYWRYASVHGLADGVFFFSSLYDIREFLRKQGARGYGLWGDVHIVAHGAGQEALQMRLSPEDRRPRDLWAWRLKEAWKLPEEWFENPINSLDKNSRLIFHACEIGGNQPLLDAIRGLFGNATTVYAPKLLEDYWQPPRAPGQRRPAPRVGFFEIFTFVPKQRKAPAVARCIDALRDKYPKSGITDEHWRRMLRTSRRTARRTGRLLDGFRLPDDVRRRQWRVKLDVAHQAPELMPKKIPKKIPSQRQILRRRKYAWLRADLEEAQQLDWLDVATDQFNDAPAFERENTTFDQWGVEEGPLRIDRIDENNTYFSKRFRLHRVIIMVVRELRTTVLDHDTGAQTTVPVKPELENKDHYGRSPAQ